MTVTRCQKITRDFYSEIEDEAIDEDHEISIMHGSVLDLIEKVRKTVKLLKNSLVNLEILGRYLAAAGIKLYLKLDLEIRCEICDGARRGFD